MAGTLKEWHTKNGSKVTQLLSGRSNVFLLTHKNKHILIDTSPGRKWKKLDRRLKELNISGLDYLILTHSHFDHAGNALKIKQQYKAKVFIHENETNFLTTGTNPAIHGTNKFSRIIAGIATKMFLKKAKYTPCSYDYAVNSSYDLSTPGFNAYILHTPGHSPGSMSIIVDDEIAIVGDCMFGVIRSSVFPPFAENTEQLIGSWGKLLDCGCTTFLPSHGKERSRLQLYLNYQKHKKQSGTK